MTRREAIAYAIIILTSVPSIVARFMHPDSTSLRVLLDYWHLILLPIVGILIAARIMKGENRP